jgi:hypothetical protein
VVPLRKRLSGVLRSFLGTFVSRNTDAEGYWLFGQVVSELVDVEIDLAPSDPGTVAAAGVSGLDLLRVAARRRFEEQLAKARLASSRFSSACLRMVRMPGDVTFTDEEGRTRSGFRLSLEASSVTARGTRVRCTTSIVVAPHDPTMEHRRHAKDWGLK